MRKEHDCECDKQNIFVVICDRFPFFFFYYFAPLFNYFLEISHLIMCHCYIQQPGVHHGSWIYNYLYNHRVVSLNHAHGKVYSIHLCDNVCQWFSPPIKLTATILLKVAINTITLTPLNSVIDCTFGIVFFKQIRNLAFLQRSINPSESLIFRNLLTCNLVQYKTVNWFINVTVFHHQL